MQDVSDKFSRNRPAVLFHVLAWGAADNALEVAAEERLRRKVQQFAYLLHIELAAIEQLLDTECNVLADDHRGRLAHNVLRNHRQVFGRHTQPLGIELHGALVGVVGVEQVDKLFEDATRIRERIGSDGGQRRGRRCLEHDHQVQFCDGSQGQFLHGIVIAQHLPLHNQVNVLETVDLRRRKMVEALQEGTLLHRNVEVHRLVEIEDGVCLRGMAEEDAPRVLHFEGRAGHDHEKVV